MILCRNLKVIFFKTRKVGGTSFEIALSKYCDPHDIVTPITPSDEVLRAQLGFQGPVNFSPEERSQILVKENVRGAFNNHMTSKSIYKKVGRSIFESYTKISIQRDPLDFLISLYFFKINQKPVVPTPSFAQWLPENYTSVIDNYKIAPATGKFAPDVTLRYECLIEDIQKLDLPDEFTDVFQNIRAKGNLRSSTSRDVRQFYEENDCSDFVPKIEQLVREQSG